MFPGSKRPIVGAIKELLRYQQERQSDKVVEVDSKWLIANMHLFLDKKQQEVPKWNPIMLKYMLGKLEMFVADPEVIGEIMADNKIVDKHSHLKEFIFNARLKDSVITMSRCSEQIQRRRAFMNCFSGTSNFNILDQTV